MRFIAKLLMLVVLVVIGMAAYTYWTNHRGSLPAFGGVDAERTKQRGAELANKAEKLAGETATKLEAAMGEGALTAKIKSKIALDDYVKARTIDVTTSGSTVTLTGTVESAAERERAVRLARETEGVTNVVDKLEVKKS
jgi:osmotically-inducible protein OsmY